MLIRLGPEAAEAIDEFLDLALAYDREAAPSLQGFIDQLRGGDIEIKRDMEQGRDEVRIMTVHGAKGLQAPIVFLPDTCMNVRPQGVRLFPLPRPGEPPEEVAHLIWAAGGRTDLEEIDEPKEMLKRADREEYHRLLYVAMTRARDRLYVCGWQGQKEKPEGESWYELINDGLGGLLAEIPTVRRRVRAPYGMRTRKAHQERRAKSRESRCAASSRLGAYARQARAGAAEAHAVAACAFPGRRRRGALRLPASARSTGTQRESPIRPRAAGACPSPASAGDRA